MTGSLLDMLGRKAALCAYLTGMEFEKRFAGSVGGRVWVFLGPLMTITVIWLALDLGLGLRASMGPNYGMALAVGLSAWLFFAEAVNTSISSVSGNPHLVKKVVFPVILLPSANVLAAFVVHIAVLSVVILALAVQGQAPSWSILSLPVWMGALLLLTGSVAVIVAALNVVLRDTSAIAPNVISFLFWVTPIVWPVAGVPEPWHTVAMLNPAAVIVEGYRFAVLGTSAPLSLLGTVAFLAAIGGLGYASFRGFRRLRFGFADVL